MSDVVKKIILSISGSIPNAILAVILHKVFEAWGIFDPFSEWLGGWLKMRVTQDQVEWTIPGIISLTAYAALLWIVWKRFYIPRVTTDNDRRALIAEARDLVGRLVRQYPDSAQFEKQLASDQIFYRLRPYFSEHFKTILRGRMVTYPSWEDSQIPAMAARFLDEIERIEKKWNLT